MFELVELHGIPAHHALLLVGGAVIKSDAEVVTYMLSGDFDPETEVVLTEAPPLALQGGSAGLLVGPPAGKPRWLYLRLLAKRAVTIRENISPFVATYVVCATSSIFVQP